MPPIRPTSGLVVWDVSAAFLSDTASHAIRAAASKIPCLPQEIPCSFAKFPCSVHIQIARRPNGRCAHIEGEHRIICGVFVDQLGYILRVDRSATGPSGREFVEASACLAIIHTLRPVSPALTSPSRLEDFKIGLEPVRERVAAKQCIQSILTGQRRDRARRWYVSHLRVGGQLELLHAQMLSTVNCVGVTPTVVLGNIHHFRRHHLCEARTVWRWIENPYCQFWPHRPLRGEQRIMHHLSREPRKRNCKFPARAPKTCNLNSPVAKN